MMVCSASAISYTYTLSRKIFVIFYNAVVARIVDLHFMVRHKLTLLFVVPSVVYIPRVVKNNIIIK